LLGLLSSCGSGVAAVAASSGSSSGGTTPALTDFAIPNPKVSPASVTLEASTSLRVELRYSVAGGPDLPMTLVPGPGVSANRVDLEAGANEVDWDFARDLGGARLTRDVTVRVKRGAAPVQGGELALFGMGNDAPVVHAVEPMPTDPLDPEESAGNAEIRLRISDTSSDPVDVTVEWRRESDPPGTWNRASPAGVLPDGIETGPAPGVELSFFWNTNLDVPDQESAVLFRVTADDRTDASTPFETQGPFLVDNNDDPIVIIDEVFLHENPDKRRGISIPVRLIDAESDELTLAVQWSRTAGSFPALPPDAAAVRAILADPALRKQYQVCSEFPRFVEGDLVPIDEQRVRLPEVASTAAQVLAGGLADREIEILRGSRVPAPLASTWDSNPLVRPCAVVAVRGGTFALVLDQPSVGTWRLQEVELAGGAARLVAAGVGVPDALALERDRASVLVASSMGESQAVERVTLSDGTCVPVSAWTSADHPGPLRALASIGPHAALATAGSSLLRLELSSTGAAPVTRVVTDLETPWGILIDDRHPDLVYVAETSFARADGIGRIIAVDIRRRAVTPVAIASPPGGPGLTQPTALAFSQNKTRIYVLCGDGLGALGTELRSVEMGLASEHDPVAIVCDELPGSATSIGTGPDRLLVLALPGSDELYVGGGVEQRRTIRSYDPRGQIATVSEPLTLSPARPKRWRIAQRTRYWGSPSGREAAFLWDSSEDVDGSPAYFRAMALDSDAGSISPETAFPREVVAPFWGEVTDLGQPGTTTRWADLDADGDQDMYFASANGVVTLRQLEPGVFDSAPVTLATASGTSVSDPKATDLDRDGDFDLLAILPGNPGALLVWWNDGSGSYGLDPDVIGPFASLQYPIAFTTADLDGDGLLDLIGCYATKNAAIFWQRPGRFDTDFDLLPLPSPPLTPRAVSAADLDADGDLDLTIALHPTSFAVIVLRQIARADFAAVRLAPAAALFPDINGLVSGDVDSDGYDDIVVAGNTTRVFWGPILDETPEQTTPPPTTAGPPILVDVDGNGLLDILRGRSARLQESPRTFSDRGAFVAEGATAYATTDVDLDGDPDFAASAAGSLAVMRSGPDPLSTVAPKTNIGVPLDFDSDGDLDLLRFRGVWEQSHPGFHRWRPLEVQPPATSFGNGQYAADVDGDALMDLLVLWGSSLFGEFPGYLTLYRGPVRSSTEPIVIAEFPPARFDVRGSLIASDLDGDLRTDVLLADRSTGDLHVYWQDDDTTFGSSHEVVHVGVIQGGQPIATLDVDLDNDMDLIVATTDDGSRTTLSLIVQSTARRFSGARPLLTTSDGLGQLNLDNAVDIDGDGGIDVCATSSSSDLIALLWHDDSSGFDAVPALVASRGPAADLIASVCADLDGDGDQDVLTQDNASTALLLYPQRGPRRFDGIPMRYAVPFDFSLLLVVADIDTDGDADVLTSGSTGARVNLGRQ
jgi:hypothetical protein